MADNPDTLVTPHKRPCVQYINARGELVTVYVTVYPSGFAEGVQGSQSVLPKDHLDLE